MRLEDLIREAIQFGAHHKEEINNSGYDSYDATMKKFLNKHQVKNLFIHSVVNSNCDKKPKKCKHKYGLFTHINNGQNLMFKCKKCKRDMTYEQLQIERKERK